MTAPVIIDCEQGSPEWYAARMKMPTASAFKDVMAEGKGLSRLTYMRKLAGECLTGRPMENHTNKHMDRGREREPVVLAEYQFLTGSMIERVGFIHNGIAGCSPDGLIGKDGMVEVKDALPHILVEIMLRMDFPPEHRAQTQGSLWVAQRKWCDLVVGCDGAIPYIRRTFRNETYIAELEREIIRFNKELAAMVKHLKAKR